MCWKRAGVSLQLRARSKHLVGTYIGEAVTSDILYFVALPRLLGCYHCTGRLCQQVER